MHHLVKQKGLKAGVNLMRDACKLPSVSGMEIASKLPILKDARRQEVFVDVVLSMIADDSPPQYQHYIEIFQHRTLKSEVAVPVWQIMKREGVVPSYPLASAMLDFCARTKNLKMALEIWNRFCTEAPWPHPDVPDPLPSPPPARTLRSLTLNELHELPMWLKVSDLHPNTKLKEANRYNCTRDVYFNMIRCLYSAGRVESAFAMFKLLESKLLETPSPAVAPVFAQEATAHRDPLFYADHIKNWKRLEAWKTQVERSKFAKPLPRTRNPFRWDGDEQFPNDFPPPDFESRTASNHHFLCFAYLTAIRESPTLEHALALTDAFSKKLGEDTKLYSAFARLSPDLVSSRQNFICTAPPAVVWKRLTGGHVRKVQSLRSFLDTCKKNEKHWWSVIEELSTRPKDKALTEAERHRMKRLSSKLSKKEALEKALKAVSEQKSVDVVKDAKNAKYAKAFLKLQTSAAGLRKWLGRFSDIFPKEEVEKFTTVSANTDPLESLALPTKIATPKEASGDLSHVICSLLQHRVKMGQLGAEVEAAMRQLTSEPLAFQPTQQYRQIVDGPMIQLCIQAYLAQLSKKVPKSDHKGKPEQLMELRNIFAKNENRAEAKAVLKAVNDLFRESRQRGIVVPYQTQLPYLEILAIVGAPVCKYFSRSVLHQYRWDGAALACLAVDVINRPHATRMNSFLKVKQWASLYDVELPTDVSGFLFAIGVQGRPSRAELGMRAKQRFAKAQAGRPLKGSEALEFSAL